VRATTIADRQPVGGSWFWKLKSAEAILAPDRKGQGPQPAPRNLGAALEAVAECPFIQPRQRFFNPVQGLRLHLDQGEFDIVLDIRFRRLSRIQHALPLAETAFGPHVTHLLLHLGQDLATAFLEDLLELDVSFASRIGLDVLLA
jgi:hypothetical protein